MKRILALSVTLVAAGMALAPAAHADERICTSSIGAETVDNLKVPSGATCTLSGTIVEGNIVVESGATLTADGVDVDGNIQAEGHGQVTVRSSRVGGSVQIEQGGGADVRDSAIDSDLQYSSNRAPLAAISNVIGGNLQAMANTGGLTITGNTIDGNLQCKENDPSPTGSGNVVRGSAEDQCASLTGGGGTPPPAATFCDTAGHTHEASIDKVATAGIAQGGTDGCYRPNDPVTRGQMATFLTRGYSLPPGSATFCDTAGHTHEGSIGAVATAGIAQGGTDGCYRPNDPVTRGQMATFLTRAEQLTPVTPAGFCDTAGHTHEGSIGAVATAGIAQGGTDGCYRPNDPVTRGRMATFLVRALGL
jgi:hypothetical protein